MGHMREVDLHPYEHWFWKKNRINLIKDFVERCDFSKKTLHLKSSDTLSYDKLVLATGSSYNKFGWPGQDLKGVGGMYSLQDVEKIEYYSKGLNRAVIVGGGLIGIELAEMFRSRDINVTMLVRENSFWDMVLPGKESAMINNHILEHGVDLRLQTELKEIIDNGQGKAAGVITNKDETIDCGFVGLTAGVHPNINFLRESGIEIKKGIVVNECLETNKDNVYAIGDCSQQKSPLPGRRPVEAIWYTGRMMGEVAAYNICDKRVKYDPGIWFNSAKFFDIEYQVYGTVLADPPGNHESIFWMHESGKKSIRIVFDNRDNSILGFNLMGVRFRHEVCEKWLRQRTNVEDVLANLNLALFDPEFYINYLINVVSIYNNRFNKHISVKKSKWENVFSFLRS